MTVAAISWQESICSGALMLVIGTLVLWNFASVLTWPLRLIWSGLKLLTWPLRVVINFFNKRRGN